MDAPRDIAEYRAMLKQAMERYPPIWTIYNNPRDFPGKIVVRCWYGEVPHPDMCVAANIEAARDYCQRKGGEVCLGRQPGDDPVIVESWI